MNFKGRKILITGADGFIGSHLTETLVRAGADVRAMVYYNSFDSWGWLDDASADVRGKFEVFMGDVRDPYGVRKAVEGREIVFHLAALIAIPYSYHSPDAYVDTNVKGTLNVLQACRDARVHRLIHTSTSEVYGTAQFVPITEEHPLRGQSPYSATKIAADQLALSFFDSFNLPVVIARPFNTYGPRQSTRAIVPTIITQIAAGHKSLKLGALDPTRDLNYVSDTVEGFLALAASDQAVGEVVNLGSGFEISIAGLAEMICSLMGSSCSIEGDRERLRPEKSEVRRLCADAQKAFRIASWKPEKQGSEGLRAGLEQTIAWFTDPKNLAQYKTGQYTL